ncbi:hypothetical protein F5I97DRAFT_1990402 [Phlebopus sp. FC_14]|nr:hypothetical protein F5I97DRAFT_1990402 [Phlebopus sp. FC_14]
MAEYQNSETTTVISEHAPDAYERASYYNGITGDGDHPELVYRSDYLTTPFPKPEGRFAYIPVKSLRGVFDTPLNKVWDTVGPQIRDIVKAQEIKWSSIDTARFFTHGPTGEEKGSLGPVVIWIGVLPGSTSADTAHDVSQQILALLQKNEVEGVVVEWREAVAQRLAGPPLLKHADSTDPTHYLRRFLTALLAVPLTTQGMKPKDAQGTLTFWFAENKDKDGNASDQVYGGRSTQGPTKGDESPEGIRKVQRLQRLLDDENEDIATLEIPRRGNDVLVDEGSTRYTADWGVFLAAGAKVKDAFEGNVVDLGSTFSPPELSDMFYPVAGGPTTLKYPEERKLKITGCATKDDLANPAEFDNEGQRCLKVGKDGNTTDLTVGRYSGLESFVQNPVGVESRELAIYNSGHKAIEVFSAKGDSGSLVWHMKEGDKAYIVGQLHSGYNKGGSTSNHVTYCTPGWWLLAQTKKKYKHAVFFPENWPVRGQV